MSRIKDVFAREVLDSRGNPTIEVDLLTEDKCWGRAIVPSGASTGAYEALELRDNDAKRYLGKGVQKAIYNVNTLIRPAIKKMDVRDQALIDQTLIELDGTEAKTKLGANAILGVSMAVARASAMSKGQNLYHSLNGLTKQKMSMPIPFSNVINGGAHAGNSLAIQEFMIVPVKAKNFADATRMVSETYHNLKSVIKDKYGKNATNVGDEGGFAPPLQTPEEALDLITSAIQKAGYTDKIKIALDAAASEFKKENVYAVSKDKNLNSFELAKYYQTLISKYDIISVEDGFDQDDFEGWANFTKNVNIQVVGDDLLVTNPQRIKTAINQKLCNALLLKINQIGTITEALDAARLAYKAKWKVMVSHRSGESEDPFIADLSVALGSGQIKLGAPCRTDRTAKYNQLIRIEEELGRRAKLQKI